LLKKTNRELPEQPGVYLFKTAKRVLYVGKAKNLKKRINQYFQKSPSVILQNLLTEAEEIDFIITDNEKDALHLEYNLIHQHQPPFNIRLKDDKSFPLIEVTRQEEFPGIYFSRDPDHRSRCFGPITSARKTKELIDFITRVFKIRTCSTQIFNQSKLCLFFYIDRCSGPCEGKISKTRYQSSVTDTLNFLKGERHKIISRLRQQMARLAEELNFEEADHLKNQIQLINNFQLESYISKTSRTDYDVLVVTSDQELSFIILFKVVKGKVRNREFFSLNLLEQREEEVLRHFLLSHYQPFNLPDEIVVSILPHERSEIESVLSRIRGKRVSIRLPKRGIKKHILDLAQKNLNLYISKNRYDQLGRSIQDELALTNYPDHIEAFDISHFSERERVGAVVVFRGGQPQKQLYRNFQIRRALPGDTEAMKEMMRRRFHKYDRHPDLILIDGGKGQLGIAKQLKAHFNISSDLVALAKKDERLYLEGGNSVVFAKDSPERLFFQLIRDEAHRRAIAYHRKKREKLVKSRLRGKK
jgi:excinuclease ABC subunit C